MQAGLNQRRKEGIPVKRGKTQESALTGDLGDVREKFICFCNAREKIDHFLVLCVKADGAVMGEEGKCGKAAGFPKAFRIFLFQELFVKEISRIPTLF